MLLPIWDKRTGIEIISSMFKTYNEPVGVNYGQTSQFSSWTSVSWWKTTVKHERQRAEKFQMTGNDCYIDSISVYLKRVQADEEATAHIYDNSGNLLETSNELTISSTGGQWYTFTLAGTTELTTNSYYYIEVYADAPNSNPGDKNYVQIAYSDSGGTYYYADTNNYATVADPITWTSYTGRYSLYCSCTEIPTRGWNVLFNGYLNGGNATVEYNTLHEGYLTGGNFTGFKQLLNGYLSGGTDIVTWDSLFNGYLTGGNNTYWNTLLNGYLTSGNTTVTWDTLFNGYLSGGNDAPMRWQTILQGYLSGGNDTNNFYPLSNGYLIGGNNTVAWTELFNGYLKGGNNIYNWNNILNGYLRGSNNTVIWNELFSGYLTGRNTSYGIAVTSIYPLDEALNIPVNATLRIIIYHTNGTLMNISWYRDNGSMYLGSHNNIGNGTYMIFSNANTTNTKYWWSFNITDGTKWYNSTQWFRTGSTVPTGGRSIVVTRGRNIKMNEYMLMVMVIAFGCTMFFLNRRKKQKR